jgi:hypothetical protein
MSNQLHKLKIDLLKIPSAAIKPGKNGRTYLIIDVEESQLFQGKTALYLDIDMRENRDGEDQYGNTHMLVISPTKEQRLAKEKTPIVGNAKTFVFPERNMPQSSAPKRMTTDDDDSAIPF